MSYLALTDNQLLFSERRHPLQKTVNGWPKRGKSSRTTFLKTCCNIKEKRTEFETCKGLSCSGSRDMRHILYFKGVENRSVKT